MAAGKQASHQECVRGNHDLRGGAGVGAACPSQRQHTLCIHNDHRYLFTGGLLDN
jgi:hypothetical protein